MSTWYYMKDGARSGPVSTDELSSLITAGTIPSNTVVWREGMASWSAANTLPEFSAIAPPPPPAAAAATPPAGGPGVEIPDPADVEKNKIFGVLCYLPPLLFIVALLAARNSRFAMYHCNQGVVLTIAAFACWVVNMILGTILAFIPVLGWILMLLLNLGVMIGVIALALIGLINAAKGECKPLPLIGNRFTLVK